MSRSPSRPSRPTASRRLPLYRALWGWLRRVPPFLRGVGSLFRRDVRIRGRRPSLTLESLEARALPSAGPLLQDVKLGDPVRVYLGPANAPIDQAPGVATAKTKAKTKTAKKKPGESKATAEAGSNSPGGPTLAHSSTTTPVTTDAGRAPPEAKKKAAKKAPPKDAAKDPAKKDAPKKDGAKKEAKVNTKAKTATGTAKKSDTTATKQ